MLARRFLAAPAARSLAQRAVARAPQPLTLRLAPRRSLVLSFSTFQFSPIVHKSPHPEIDIPKKTIWDIVGEQAEHNGDKTAFICGLTHERVSFRELYENSKRVAVALAEDGVRKGDVRGALGHAGPRFGPSDARWWLMWA